MENFEQSVFARAKAHNAIPILTETEGRASRDTLMKEFSYDRREAAWQRQKKQAYIPLGVYIASLVFTQHSEIGIEIALFLSFIVTQMLAIITLRRSTGSQPWIWALPMFCAIPVDELRPLIDSIVTGRDRVRFWLLVITLFGLVTKIVLFVAGLIPGHGAGDVYGAALFPCSALWGVAAIRLWGRIHKYGDAPWCSKARRDRLVESCWRKNPDAPTAPRHSLVGKSALGLRAWVAKKTNDGGGTQVRVA